jgi:hypothetical protein
MRVTGDRAALSGPEQDIGTWAAEHTLKGKDVSAC